MTTHNNGQPLRLHGNNVTPITAVSKPVRVIKHKNLSLSKKDITVFLHNAQLALCEVVEDEKIPALYYYKTHLLKAFQGSKFSQVELACILSSLAYELFTGGKNGNSGSGT